MTPYYQQSGITIYHGDARGILPMLFQESIITDPVWPNSVFGNVEDPQLLLAETLNAATAQRVVIHLGCDSDPRFLAAVPKQWPFMRVCWLDYAQPSYKGRILYGSDVAYVFGEPPEAKPGRFLMPGKCMAQRTGVNIQRELGGPTSSKKQYTRNKDHVKSTRLHPCPRRPKHVQWLVKWFSGESLCDPFCGSGTTLLAAKLMNIKAVGIDIEERYLEIAARRLQQEILQLA